MCYIVFGSKKTSLKSTQDTFQLSNKEKKRVWQKPKSGQYSELPNEQTDQNKQNFYSLHEKWDYGGKLSCYIKNWKFGGFFSK